MGPAPDNLATRQKAGFSIWHNS